MIFTWWLTAKRIARWTSLGRGIHRCFIPSDKEQTHSPLISDFTRKRVFAYMQVVCVCVYTHTYTYIHTHASTVHLIFKASNFLHSHSFQNWKMVGADKMCICITSGTYRLLPPSNIFMYHNIWFVELWSDPFILLLSTPPQAPL